MLEAETIQFVQIAAAKDHLYGMTAAGAVWKYDPDRQRWEPMSMAFSRTAERPGFNERSRLVDASS